MQSVTLSRYDNIKVTDLLPYLFDYHNTKYVDDDIIFTSENCPVMLFFISALKTELQQGFHSEAMIMDW